MWHEDMVQNYARWYWRCHNHSFRWWAHASAWSFYQSARALRSSSSGLVTPCKSTHLTGVYKWIHGTIRKKSLLSVDVATEHSAGPGPWETSTELTLSTIFGTLGFTVSQPEALDLLTLLQCFRPQSFLQAGRGQLCIAFADCSVQALGPQAARIQRKQTPEPVGHDMIQHRSLLSVTISTK